MKQKSGNLIYKCRRCGGLDRSIGVPNLMEDLTHIVLFDNPRSEGIKPHKIMTHSCEDGNLGVMDLQGGEYDKK